MAMGYDGCVTQSDDITHIGETQEVASKFPTLRVRGASMEAEDIIRRMRQVYGVTTDTALAAALNLTISAPSNWRQRNSPPFAICAQIAAEKGISLDWLIFGVGDMQLGMRAEAPHDSGHAENQPAKSPAVERLSRFVYWWYVNRTQDEMIWLEQQFKRAVPEYADWLANSLATGA